MVGLGSEGRCSVDGGASCRVSGPKTFINGEQAGKQEIGTPPRCWLLAHMDARKSAGYCQATNVALLACRIQNAD
jgi:hypothetical protein